MLNMQTEYFQLSLNYSLVYSHVLATQNVCS